MQRASPCSRPTIVQLGKRKRKQDMDKKACSKTRGKIKVTCCSRRTGHTVTSSSDLGETFHPGLYLLHAVIAHGMALLQQAHACTKFHHCFQHSQRQLNFSANFTPRRAINSGVSKQPFGQINQCLPCLDLLRGHGQGQTHKHKHGRTDTHKKKTSFHVARWVLMMRQIE